MANILTHEDDANFWEASREGRLDATINTVQSSAHPKVVRATVNTNRTRLESQGATELHIAAYIKANR
ncbi:hypothetical protein GCM10027278_36940 [Paralcaligenes ginsengisoli]